MFNATPEQSSATDRERDERHGSVPRRAPQGALPHAHVVLRRVPDLDGELQTVFWFNNSHITHLSHGVLEDNPGFEVVRRHYVKRAQST